MSVKLMVYDKSKYEADAENIFEKVYTIDGFEVVSGYEAEEIEIMSDAESVDENHEYLVIHFSDGTTATYCNSHADLFRY